MCETFAPTRQKCTDGVEPDVRGGGIQERTFDQRSPAPSEVCNRLAGGLQMESGKMMQDDSSRKNKPLFALYS